MTKKERFDIFRRDNFTCQYCGRKVPEVVLEIDHIIPKSKKGTEDKLNLITSCFECNRGKSSTDLREKIKKEDIDQSLKESKERELQLKEYFKHQSNIEKKINQKVNNLAKYWSSLANNEYSLNPRGKASIKRFLNYFTPQEIKEAMEIALRVDDIEGRFKYMCGVLHNKKRQKEEGENERVGETS